MPKLIWTEEDEQLIVSLVEEFEPTKHPLMAPLVEHLSSDEWDRWTREMRDYVRRQARVILSLKALMVDLKGHSVPLAEYPDAVRNALLHISTEAATVPEDITLRTGLPDTPDGEWGLQNGYIIEVGNRLRERFLEGGLDLVGAQS